MDKQVVKICWLSPKKNRGLRLPSYATAGAAGMDIEAGVCDSIVVHPGERVLISTEFSVALPEGYEMQVRPRSGLAVNHGVTVLNSPGTIDSDYRGEVKIALINLGQTPYTIKRGDRIAQLVLAPVTRATFTDVPTLDSTQRDTGGFGHTGG